MLTNTPRHKSLKHCLEGSEYESKKDYEKAISSYKKAFVESQGHYDIGDCSAKALNSLIYLCSKQKWYDKELEVIGLYIEEFMQCNEFLAEVYIEMYSEFEEAAFNALETNTPIDEVNEYGSPPLEQYDLNNYITRREEVLNLIEKEESKKIANLAPEFNPDFTPKYRKFEIKLGICTITLECPKCKCLEFHVMNDPFFVCRDCGSYYNDFQQLLDEGGSEQLDNAYTELAEELTKRLTERFG